MFILILSFLWTVSVFATGEDLHSFCAGLDQTLRHFNKPQRSSCAHKSLTSSPHSASYQGHKATVLSEIDAQKLFAEMSSQTDIPFNFVVDGCKERAHEMSRLMLLKGIRPLKMFASVDVDEPPRLEVPHPSKPGQVIRWRHHVAPIVLVKKNGELIPYVIDPSIEKRAVPVDEWKKHMTQHDSKMEVRMTLTEAERYLDTDPLPINFSDENLNRSVQNKLKEFKELSKDPYGEDDYLFRLQRDEERLMEMQGN